LVSSPRSIRREEPAKQLAAEHRRVRNVKRLLQGGAIEAATTIGDLAALPGNRFENLKGDRKGQSSIRINDKWRICFEWPAGSPGPINVEIVDYH
jgi:plasmid maintenance system killer protein